MTGFSPERIAELRKVCDAATEGPWDHIQGGLVRAIKGDLAVPIFRSEAPIDWHKKQNLTHPVLCKAYVDEVNNAAFIAAARTELPAALDEIERLTEERDESGRGWRRKCAEVEAERDAAIAERDDLRQVLKDCADDLASEVNHRWQMNDGTIHPANLTKYSSDMDTVLRARAALTKDIPND